ncbi:FAD binding domain-containing protein [Pseudonocardia sp. H11422]|uniref:FAD binding domain-containing protein n=1 Tax=Pseudonocardia sp. H11422 TaxID=2835866 RepID=UPI001BDBFC2F|nr:xanthine dehydrogenase family protein subunit M [Pseudonocardia sp. H11422]
MKPSSFKYAVPSSIEEAVDLLAQHGDEAKVLAGGQSLVPLMNMRLARPSILVDIAEVADLKEISANGALSIGAAAAQGAVMDSDDVRAVAPIIAEAMGYVGHAAIRNRGTLGGSAAHADPAAEAPAVLLALDATMVAVGPMGRREISAEDFFVSTFTTSLEPDELLTEVRVPRPPTGARSAFLEVARRHGDFALVGAAIVADVGADDVCTAIRIALSGVAGTPIRLAEVESLVVGRRISEVLDEAGGLASDFIDPGADFHASAKYRKQVAGVLVSRGLGELVNRETVR